MAEVSTYKRISLDDLLWALGAFAEPEEDWHTRRRRLLVKYRAQGLPYSVISERIGHSANGLRVTAHHLGITRRCSGPYSLDVRRRAIAMVMAGESLASVARSFGVSHRSVRAWSRAFQEARSAALVSCHG